MRRSSSLAALIVLIIPVALALTTQCALAETLAIEKTVENTDINVGDDVTILLRFTNPFGTEIPIRLVDKNVLGNNGLDIQCLERTLPPQRETTLAYDPIKPYAPGSYTLEPATVTYTNPETGKEETATSNALEITVNGTAAQGQAQAQGITTIYECGGQSMRSTSYSSGSSMSVQIGGSAGTGGGMQSQQSQQNQQEGDPGDLVQNNQMNQNIGAIKEEMQKEIQKQQQMGDEFKKRIAENPEFQKKHQELLDEGYNLTNASFDPVSNNTGDFTLGYRKPDGETAHLAGAMENGTMQELMSRTSEEEKAIMDALAQDPEFQRLDEQMRQNGFERGAAAFDQLSQNHTKITVPYEGGGGGGEETGEGEDGRDGREAKMAICADYINGTIENVTIVGEDEKRSYSWWILLLALILCAVCAAGWFGYRKYLVGGSEVQMVDMPVKMDYITKAMEMLAESTDLFERGEEKRAYMKVSEAVRFYFSHRFGGSRELTSAETVRLMKTSDQNFRKVKECLDRCGLVEFARLQPDAADFWEVVEVAEGLIR